VRGGIDGAEAIDAGAAPAHVGFRVRTTRPVRDGRRKTGPSRPILAMLGRIELTASPQAPQSAPLWELPR